MAGFAAGERRWIERLGGLRNTIRQEVIARQLAERVAPGSTVLDVGCGQGTQALRLAERGCTVTGVDPSAELLAHFERDAARAGLRVEAIAGRVEALRDAVGDRRFDVVTAHGLLMYLPDTRAALAALAERVAAAGLLSVTFRNGHALALRPALRRDWAGALRALDADAYVNELGVEAAAHRLDAIEATLAALGFRIEQWFGVRVFNDAVPSDAPVPGDAELAALLDAEEQAGCRDPYRWLASQLHVIATRE
jgi:2-polyprenyl-3-methyl-5-hydroxy-6-metoxy-1,4-benzoquinol methylase